MATISGKFRAAGDFFPEGRRLLGLGDLETRLGLVRACMVRLLLQELVAARQSDASF